MIKFKNLTSQIHSILSGYQNIDPRLYDAILAIATQVDNNVLASREDQDNLVSLNSVLNGGNPGSYLQTNINQLGLRDLTTPLVWKDPLDILDVIEDFESGNENIKQVLSGTGSIVSLDSDGNHIGLIRLATGTTSTSVAGTSYPADPLVDSSDLLTIASLSYLGIIAKYNHNTDVNVLLGMAQTITTLPTGGTDGVFFRLDSAVDTQVRFVTRKASVETTTVIHTPTLGTYYKYEIKTDGADLVAYLDRVEVARHTTDIPTAIISPGFIIRNVAAVNKTLDVDFFRFIVKGMGR